MSRAQVRGTVLAESLLVSAYGAVLGLAVGGVLGSVLVRALAPQGVRELVIPWSRLAVFLATAAVGGLVAAGLPARRAAHLDVLSAVACE